MATTKRANERKAEKEAEEVRNARLDQGGKLLALARIMAGLTPREPTPEREYLNGFVGGFEHGLELAAADPAAAERWRAWMAEVLHHGRQDLATALRLHAESLASGAPREL